MAWRFGGACPYRTYHGLDEQYRDALGVPHPPPFPRRLRMFIYGMAKQAEVEEYKRLKAMAGAK